MNKQNDYHDYVDEANQHVKNNEAQRKFKSVYILQNND